MSQNTGTTLLNTKTTAHFSIEPGKPPVITSGELTPELLADFENGCFAYFAWKDVAEDRQVMKIAWGLQDARVQVWYRTDRDKINAAGFTAFMKSVRTQWLPAGWEHNVKCLILSSSQQNLPVADSVAAAWLKAGQKPKSGTRSSQVGPRQFTGKAGCCDPS